jgi:hypothetical protein
MDRPNLHIPLIRVGLEDLSPLLLVVVALHVDVLIDPMVERSVQCAAGKRAQAPWSMRVSPLAYVEHFMEVCCFAASTCI